MKYLLTLLFFALFLNVKSQWLSTTTFNPVAPTSCDTVIATINGTLQCGNSVISLDSIQSNGNYTKVYLNEFTPQICLPVILSFSFPTNVGFLPAGIDTIEILLYKNGSYTENQVNTINVINSGNNFSSNQNICAGDSLFLAGQWRFQSGSYTDTIPGTSCDTFLTTILTVGGYFNDSNKISICMGDSVFLAGAWQKNTGVFLDSFLVGSGCDSVVQTQLTLGNHKTQSRSLTICQGAGVFAGGKFTDVPGTYLDTFLTYLGCDSIIQTQLNVNQKDTIYQFPIICSGESYFAGGQLQTTGGLYYDYLQNVNACDSLIVTDLTVNSSYTNNRRDTICEGDSILFGGYFLNSGGLYDDTLNTINGCDSIIRLLLTILNGSSLNIDTGVCLKDSLIINSKLISSSGNYNEFYIAKNGCDSLINYAVIIYPKDSSFYDTTANLGDSIFAGGFYQTQPGIYFDFYENVFGCDSILKTTIKFDQPETVINGFWKDSFIIYPNPTSRNIFIKSSKLIKHIEVLTIMGEKIHQVENPSLETTFIFPKSGIYLVKIFSKNGPIYIEKVIVTH